MVTNRFLNFVRMTGFIGLWLTSTPLVAYDEVIKEHLDSSKQTNKIGSETKNTDWNWSIVSSDLMESIILVSKNNKSVARYAIACNLSDVNHRSDSLQTDEEVSRVEFVSTTKLPDKVLLVSCTVGAHARLISVYDPMNQSSEPVFSKVGSYYAYWEIETDQLLLHYDQPCPSEQQSCDRFQKVTVPWPM
jgi:hypothetical protein